VGGRVDARAGLESGFALLFEKLFLNRAGEDLKQLERPIPLHTERRPDY